MHGLKAPLEQHRKQRMQWMHDAIGALVGLPDHGVAHSAEMLQMEHLFICNIRLGPGKLSVVPQAATTSESYNLTCSSVRGKPY